MKRSDNAGDTAANLCRDLPPNFPPGFPLIPFRYRPFPGETFSGRGSGKGIPSPNRVNSLTVGTEPWGTREKWSPSQSRAKLFSSVWVLPS
jgi:hypothetical protein